MVVYRTLPSFTLALSQLIEASEAEGFERGSSTSASSSAPAASPSSEHVDLMKTIDCRTDSEDYDDNDDDDDYWNFKHQASSDYEAFCNGYYDDDADAQTLFDEPLPLSYGMKLTRQSRGTHHHLSTTRSSSRSGSSGTAGSTRESSSDESSSPRPKPFRKGGVPLAWNTMVRRITSRTKGFTSPSTTACTA